MYRRKKICCASKFWMPLHIWFVLFFVQFSKVNLLSRVTCNVFRDNFYIIACLFQLVNTFLKKVFFNFWCCVSSDFIKITSDIDFCQANYSNNKCRKRQLLYNSTVQKRRQHIFQSTLESPLCRYLKYYHKNVSLVKRYYVYTQKKEELSKQPFPLHAYNTYPL